MIDLGFVFLGLALVALALLAFAAVKIVPEYQRLVVLRLGRCIGERGPGFVFLIPFVDRPIRVDLRESFVSEPKQVCITKDNASISIDFLIYWRVFDATSSVIKVKDFAGAAEGIATTTLRAVVGDLSLDDVLAKRERINEVLRLKLDEITDRWGVKVTAVEISEILPPHEVQQAMTRQMSAERNRRAVVTEADGKREATIKVAEGDKQSAILRAEGERQAAILTAEGFSLALDKIFSVAKTIDAKTMSLQYLEALKSLGASPATKFVLPMEFTNLLRPFLAHTEKAAE
ncbi:MAG: SPFH/Band 7/PHB domain protein [Anaerolineae bacterium]|nr:SPFH/Band 7/PHB domain protein [Anaerolineae bacterium]